MGRMRGTSVFGGASVVGAIVFGAACTTTDTVTGASGTGGAAPQTALTLPQFIGAAAWVDTVMQSAIPLVVDVTGPIPDAVEVVLDGVATPAVAEAGRYVATLAVGSLSEGTHDIIARARTAGVDVSQVKGTLVAGAGSRQVTSFSHDGAALAGNVVVGRSVDALELTWRAGLEPKRGFVRRRVDGAFRPLDTADTLISAPEHDALDGETAFGPDGVAVAYRVTRPSDQRWEVKLRAVGHDGKEQVPVTDLTAGGASYSVVAAGADPRGYSAAWLHLRSAVDGMSPPVELRYARYDLETKQLLGPLTLDTDEPPPMGSMEGTQRLEPLGEIDIACNDALCLVSYSRQVYNAYVQLNFAKLFVAAIDLTTGVATTAVAVSAIDWDTQLFGHHLVALPDGSFAMTYTATDTAAAVDPKDPCDTTIQRDLLRFVRFDAKGTQLAKPSVILDHEGSRQFPRLAPHPSGFAMLWEDQRSYCGSQTGHLRMAASFLDAAGKLGDYHELPDSIGIPPEDPMVTVLGTNAELIWSDNRHGGGIFDLKLELYADTLWSK